MTRRVVRLAVLVLLLAGLGAAAYLLIGGERHAATRRGAAREFDILAIRTGHALAEVRSAQQAYVAPAQDPAWWHQRAVTRLATIAETVDTLRAGASDPDALDGLDAAAADLEALREIDARAGRLVSDARLEEAAAVIYAEAFDAVTAIARRVESARNSELQALERELLEGRRAEALIVAGAAVLALIVVLLLALSGDRGTARADVSAGGTPEAAPAGTGPAGDLPLTAPVNRAARPPLELAVSEPAFDPVQALAPPTADAPAEAGPPAAPESVPRDRRRAPELRAAADLCTDFARLLDSQELPGLLERAAQLLDATGLIIWASAAGGDELRPLLAHGYTSQALSRLPAIPRDADNATAAAFREGRLEVVKTNGMSPGALVVPLLTTAGCVGVLASEVRHGREASESARALARIVAAQLATIVSLTPAHEPTESRHSAVG